MKSGKFDYFIILAGMRTGSNFLQASLNEFAGITCHGEVFNPHFIGQPNQTEMFGVTIDTRESTPFAIIDEIIRNSGGIAGFRFFHDHDPRVLSKCLADKKCAKIILTRSLLDTYVSREIARSTGQWRLGDLKNAKFSRIRFDPLEFETHVAEQQSFLQELQHELQTSGQTAFHIGYDDLSDIDVLNGLASFLGVSTKLKSVSKATKKQNPRPIEESVVNYDEMKNAISNIDQFPVGSPPVHEPKRSANIPSFVAAASSPILYMPIKPCSSFGVMRWLAGLDGVAENELLTDFSQKTLRHWKRRAGSHRSFTIVRHPVARLHDAFVRHILMPGPECYSEIRQSLKDIYKVPLPEGIPDANYQIENHRRAFLHFMTFVKGNLDGQTSIRVDGSWATQTRIVNGFSDFMLPDMILREVDLQNGLDCLTAQLGVRSVKAIQEQYYTAPFMLEEFYDADIEASVRSAYQRDYMMFGFGPWKP